MDNLDDLPADLVELLLNDEEGLFDAPVKPRRLTSDDRLERAFTEILEFVDTHGREPDPTTLDISERKLGARLVGIRATDEKVAALTPLDDLGLLAAPEPTDDLEDLLAGDDLDDLLGPTPDEADLFDTSALPERTSPATPVSKATRVKASEFAAFQPLFDKLHAALAAGEARLQPFSGMSAITPGRFFVLQGAVAYVATVYAPEKDAPVVNGRQKSRLRVVFDNGTESAMYKESLETRLYEQEGQEVALPDLFDAAASSAESAAEPSSTTAGTPADTPAGLATTPPPAVGEKPAAEQPVPEPAGPAQAGAQSPATGHIYVVRSLSEDPEIASLDNLYKIGFSTTTVEGRVRGAEKSATYLYAPVKIVADYRIEGLKASHLEHLLHAFFASARLEITAPVAPGGDPTIGDEPGASREVTEWFLVPLEAIDHAISLVETGEIVHYHYDKTRERLVGDNASSRRTDPGIGPQPLPTPPPIR